MLALISLLSAEVLRHAVIVGANEGGGSLEPLLYAESDAQRMAEVLVELGGFDPAYVTVLYAPDATELEDALTAHAAVAKSFDDDFFLLYYSGHADVRGLRLGSESYGFDTLRSDMQAMPSEVKVGILDACRSGSITRLKGAALSTPFLEEERLAAEGEAWLTAASADESAQESDQLRGSFFTHYLLSGLRGAADANDGEVSLDEAYRYAFDRVVEHTGGTLAGPQHPNFDYRLKGQGNLTLTRVTEGRSTATLPPELVGQVTVVRLPDRTPVAEVFKQAGRPVTLALVPGTYRFRVQEGSDFREAVVGLSDGSRLTISRWGAINAEVGALKGDELSPALALAEQTAAGQWLVEAINAEDPRNSPLIAGSLSLVPGGGQLYNGQWFKGALFFFGTTSLLGMSLVGNEQGDPSFFSGSLTGPDVPRMLAAGMFGWAIADAAYQVHQRESAPPAQGTVLSTATAWNWDGSWSVPATAGVNLTWLVPSTNLSLGLDRVGGTYSEGVGTWGVGGRLNFLTKNEGIKLGLFTATGLRLTHGEAQSTQVRWVMGGGGMARWYLTPRYFIEQELRLETDGGPMQTLYGGGIGVHFGG